MDVLFGAVSIESRRRDRLVVRSHLIGSVYDGRGEHESQYIHPIYPMEGKAVELAPTSPTSSPQTGTVILPHSASGRVHSEDTEDGEGEAESFEKHAYAWTTADVERGPRER